MITKKDFLDVQDFTKEEFLEMLETIRLLKEADQKGIQLPLLARTTIALHAHPRELRERDGQARRRCALP